MAKKNWMIKKINIGISLLGIPDLRELNMCLLASWIQRYYDSEFKLWREIIDCKYSIEPNVLCCVNRNASPFRKGCFGLLKQLRWTLGESMVMAKESDSRRISGLTLVV
jgi:hypothetical protein